MGHTKLGSLPRTRRWQEVVALIEGGAATAQLAQATIDASEHCLKDVAEDKGLVETIWLLTQLPLAARSEDFSQSLRACGLDASDNPGLLEITSLFSEAVDARMSNNGGRTDLGEMAQLAAVETLNNVIGSRIKSLFETKPADVRKAFSDLGTSRQFSSFAKSFFARLTNRFLNYFLSREMKNHVGEERRFNTLVQEASFSRALDIHCKEAAHIVESFSGQWFSKTNWEQGEISREKTTSFAAIAMKKLISELKEGVRSHE